MAASTRRVPLTTIAQNNRIQFPLVADIFNTGSLRTNGIPIQDGELVWFLSKSSSTNQTTFTCCTWMNSQNVFEINMNTMTGIHLALRNYQVVSRSRFSGSSLGPVMDIHSLVNLGKPDQPIFAVPASGTDNKYSLLMRDTGSRWRGRFLLHGKEEATGYLAKGVTKTFVIPGDFDQKFLFDDLPKANSTVFQTASAVFNARCMEKLLVKDVSTVNSYTVDMIQEGDVLELHNEGQIEVRRDANTGEDVEVVVFKRRSKQRRRSDIVHVPLFTRGSFIAIAQDWRTLQHCAKVTSFPMKGVKYADSCMDGNHSLDHAILLEESPLTIYGIVSYSLTHISIHLNDPAFPAFQATQSIPDYYHLDVTPASEIPVDPDYMNNFTKPKQTIQVVTAKQFQEIKAKMGPESTPTRPRAPVMSDHETPASPDHHRPNNIAHSNAVESHNPASEDDYANSFVESRLSVTEHPTDDNPDYINFMIPKDGDEDCRMPEPEPKSHGSPKANTSNDNADAAPQPPVNKHQPLQRLAQQKTRPVPVARTSLNKENTNEASTPASSDGVNLLSPSPLSNQQRRKSPPPQRPVPPRVQETTATSEMPPEANVHSFADNDDYDEYPHPGYINVPRQNSLEIGDMGAPPPMPPKKNRYSIDASVFLSSSADSATLESALETAPRNRTKSMPGDAEDAQPDKPQPPKKAVNKPPVAKKKPPKPNFLPTKPKPKSKVDKPVVESRTPQPKVDKPVVEPRSPQPNSVLDMKAQISLKLKQGNQKRQLPAPPEQNNNVTGPPLPTSPRPVAPPRRGTAESNQNTPAHAPRHPRGGVPILPVMPQMSPAAMVPSGNPRRPARVAPARPAPSRPPPNPPAPRVDKWSDPEDDDDDETDYEAIDEPDETNYEYLSESSSLGRFPPRGDVHAPTLPPNHPLGRIVR